MQRSHGVMRQKPWLPHGKANYVINTEDK